METVVRVAVIYVFVLVALRVLGKREFSQLTPFDLVILLLIPELAQQSMVREDFSITNALIGLSTLFTLVLITSVLSHLSSKAESLLSGTPTVLVSDGRILEDHLNSERVPPTEIYGEMHKVGLSDLSQVRWAILETDGKISFVPHPGTTFHAAAQAKEPLG